MVSTGIVSILGFAAAFCTTVSFVPQAVRVIKTKQTKDLSLGMYSLLNLGIILWFVYGLVMDAWPIIIANAVTLVFTITILILKIKFK